MVPFLEVSSGKGLCLMMHFLQNSSAQNWQALTILIFSLQMGHVFALSDSRWVSAGSESLKMGSSGKYSTS